MMHDSYTDSHSLRNAFVANLLGRLADKMAEQGELFLLDAGLEFPSRAASSVLIIGERGKISTADIAMQLNQPHQLVTQRIELLLGMKIIKRTGDQKDRRRKILTLTLKGQEQFKQLQLSLAMADKVFNRLFDEIESDLTLAATRAMAALNSSSIMDRVKNIENLKCNNN
ncbi:MAG: hypothetical protein JKY46_08775 [Robiginitomaculum sp.]|nr:hypothetical protein [Robiginitomaculum sp.]